MEQIRFSAPYLYPKLEVEKPDIPFAKKLLFAFASDKSEMTATTNYYYRSIVLQNKNKPLSQMVRELAKVEQKHLEILANLVFLLGYDPKIRTIKNGIPTFWNADCLDYKKDIKSVLESSIKEEQNAYKTYIFLSRQTKDPNVSRILYRLSLDEKVHIQLLKKELEKNAVQI